MPAALNSASATRGASTPAARPTRTPRMQPADRPFLPSPPRRLLDWPSCYLSLLLTFRGTFIAAPPPMNRLDLDNLLIVRILLPGWISIISWPMTVTWTNRNDRFRHRHHRLGFWGGGDLLDKAGGVAFQFSTLNLAPKESSVSSLLRGRRASPSAPGSACVPPAESWRCSAPSPH